jgi:ankyrin repeat protein
VRGGKLPLIKLLLERGAQANALDEDGLTQLLHLSKTRSKADPIPVMELLAASEANFDARDETQGTLLMYFAAGQSRSRAVAVGARRGPHRSQQEREESGGDRTRARGYPAVAYERLSRDEPRVRRAGDYAAIDRNWPTNQHGCSDCL